MLALRYTRAVALRNVGLDRFLYRFLCPTLTHLTFNADEGTFGGHFGDIGLVEPDALDAAGLIFNGGSGHGDTTMETFTCFEAGDFSVDDRSVAFGKRVY